MIHLNTVTSDLLHVAQKLSDASELNEFRLVGGTAIALHLGHRISVDIDFFTTEKISKHNTVRHLNQIFPGTEFYITQHRIASEINGVRVELWDDWGTPFLEKPMVEHSIRLAALNDLAAFKLEAIIERREKKDYVDLYVLFEALGASNILKQFKTYNPNVSDKSLLFALEEVHAARDNKSIMPEMLIKISWDSIAKSMLSAAREFLSDSQKSTKRKGRGI